MLLLESLLKILSLLCQVFTFAIFWSKAYISLEAKIGLFTDVGAGYFLSRLRGNLGYFLGLTGTRLKGAELVQTGIADFYVKKEKLQVLEKEILEQTNSQTSIEDIKVIVRKYEEKVERKYKDEEFINRVFGKCCVEMIYKALKEEEENKEFARKLVEIMDEQSSLSMKLIFELLSRGKSLDLKENLKMDMRIVLR